MIKHRITVTIAVDPEQIHPDTVAARLYYAIRNMPGVSIPKIKSVEATR